MQRRKITLFLGAVLASVTMFMPAAATAQIGRGQGQNRGWQGGPNRDAFERGYREGLRSGEQDARAGRRFDIERNSGYRNADRGYNRRDGNRNDYRNEFRRGFANGYREGYGRRQGSVFGDRDRRDNRGVSNRRERGGYQEPAFARGYSDGWEKGVEDARDSDRYDPVRHGDYREADQGYSGSYGSKDAYKNNYRAGFRQGYDEGYRDGGRRR